MSDNTPGWLPDPTGNHDHRYWDGSQWTDNVSDAGVASTDIYAATGTSDAGDATVADPPIAPEPPAPIDPTVVEPAPPAADATAAWPTTPGAPAPPPPYVPTNPVSPSGGGSKRGLLVGGGILAAVALAVVAFLALGGGDDEKSVRTQLASTLQREADLSKSDAECVADFFVDELGEDAFKGVDFDAADPPDRLNDAFDENGAAAVEKCNIDESALGGTTDTTEGSTDGTGEEGSYGSDSALDALYDDCKDGDYAACDELYLDSPAGSEYEAFAETCGERNDASGYCVDLYEDGSGSGGSTDTDLPANFEDILADTYEDSLGLSRDKAECLAGRLTGAIEDGSIDQEQVMTDFLDYLSDCDISMEEIGAN